MFDLDRFIAECRAAVSQHASHKSVREIVARAVSEPAAVIAGLGAPTRAEVQNLHNSAELTILNVIWGAGMTIMPHNHLMWAVIGISQAARTTSSGAACLDRMAAASRPPGQSLSGNAMSSRSGATSSIR